MLGWRHFTFTIDPQFASYFIVCPETLRFCALSIMECQRRVQISRLKNIGGVFELSGMAFRLAPAYGGLLVACFFVTTLYFLLGLTQPAEREAHVVCRTGQDKWNANAEY